ncbi:RsmB/NOP family class I SAM-dependent RNA methyltransferase [Paenibacillus segetis]|nr:RsmB/NOP family class I SAM-dependent RNA methyltransferase [Paenibacillus segetis]
MAVQLPITFLQRMRELLGDEYEAFLSSYDNPRYIGIRVNTLKIDVESFRAISPFNLRPIPWCPTGFYVEEGVKPGKHPYYHAGLYYIQEPSAMAPAEALDVNPGDRVLDLCAAPGGKSTQIAAKLQGQGVLVTNDISGDRTKALAKNLELYGVRNAVVLNETPERIAKSFPHFFNKIVIDAPCSGEGMFRKDEDMARLWENDWTTKYSEMQRDILKTVATMLMQGGRIVYSTCTFAPEENEAIIADFLEEHDDFELIPLPHNTGFSPGRPDWLSHVTETKGERDFSADKAAQTIGCGRLWPHHIDGEGHFLAVLERIGEAHLGDELYVAESNNSIPAKPERPSKQKDRLRGSRRDNGVKEPDERELLAIWDHFAQEQLRVDFLGEKVLFGGHIYQSPVSKERLQGLKTVRPGWYVGTIKNGRFAPGHPLATALRSGEAVRTLRLTLENGEAVRYLKGETLEIPASRIYCHENVAPKGYVLITVDGYSLGWGKWLDGILKNEYPAGWRWT